MRSDLIYIPDSELDALIQQDTPYLDLTTLGLDIGDEPGSLSFYTREPCVLCCTEEVSRILSKLGLSTAYSLPTGTQIGAGELFFTAEGSVCDLHRAWKICQSLLSHCSGGATKARNMLNRVQEISPAISLTAARAHFPGTKALVTKAVVAGGVIPHRMGLSETVLIYETHIACMGGLDVFLERYPQQKSHFCEKKVFVETTSAETALRCLSVGVDAIQFFQMQPDALAVAVEQVKAVYPHCTVVAAGNLTEENVTEYAATGVDGLVSSAFYVSDIYRISGLVFYYCQYFYFCISGAYLRRGYTDTYSTIYCAGYSVSVLYAGNALPAFQTQCHSIGCVKKCAALFCDRERLCRFTKRGICRTAMGADLQDDQYKK